MMRFVRREYYYYYEAWCRFVNEAQKEKRLPRCRIKCLVEGVVLVVQLHFCTDYYISVKDLDIFLHIFWHYYIN